MKTIKFILLKSFMLLIASMLIGYELFAGGHTTQYRWRNDDGNEKMASWKDSLNTPVWLTDVEKPLRLRIGIDNSNGGARVSISHVLEYCLVSDTTKWIDVNNDTSHAFVLISSDFILHNDTTTHLLPDIAQGVPFYTGKIISNITSSLYSLPYTGYTEFEFVLKATSVALDSTAYQFRIKGLGATPVTTHARLTTAFSAEEVRVSSVHVSTKDQVQAVIDIPGGSLSLKAEVLPSSVDQSVTWSLIPVSGDAAIDANGVVTAISNGTVYAKAVSVQDPDKSDSLEITISNQVIPLSEIQVSTLGNVPAVITDQEGTLQLEAFILPAEADQSVVWHITPVTGLATINQEGLVIALEDGSVWAKAVSVQDLSFADSIEILISGQGLTIADAHNNHKFSIIPNPVTTELQIEIGHEHEPLQLKIIDISGRVHLLKEIGVNGLREKMNLNVEFLSPGIYMIGLYNEEVYYYQRIVKM